MKSGLRTFNRTMVGLKQIIDRFFQYRIMVF